VAALRRWVVAALLAALVGAAPAFGQTREPDSLLAADEVTYDSDLDLVTARGNVEVQRGDRVLRADVLTYNRREDVVTASGNVVLMEPGGEVMFASHAEVTGDLRDGVVRDIRILLTDGARIAAAGGRRSNADRTEMAKAVYSPCELCAEDPTRPPLWQLKALRVVHDESRQTVEYRDAWLEFAGVPVLYTPYLRQPDPTIERQSGFLPPSVGNNSNLGFLARTPYYWAIDPYSDLLFEPVWTSKEGPVAVTEYRHSFRRGRLELAGSITQDSKDDVRGHVKGFGRFDLNDTWRTGFDVDRSTDDTYLRRYGFESRSILTSDVYAEGFRQRNYAAARAYSFQSLTVGADPGLIPTVLPLAEYRHVGEPGAYGLRSTLDVGVLGLTRSEGNDVHRVSTRGGWELPYIGPLGDRYTLSAKLQADGYLVDDLARPGHATEYSGSTGRVIPELGLEWRYPWVNPGPVVDQVIEPIVVGYVSPYGGNPNTIPNEDSRVVEFDETNLFEPNRFTGTDRVEGGPRVGYGVRYSLYATPIGRVNALVGQSYRVKSDDTFASGTGLDDNFSDVVTGIGLAPTTWFNLGYRARWDKDDFEARRNEVALLAGPRALQFSLAYSFFDRQGDGNIRAREEIRYGLSTQLTETWRWRASVIDDLATGGGLRSFGTGFNYEDECFIFDISYVRQHYQDRDLEPGDTVLMSIGFKTLGDPSSLSLLR